MDPSTDPPAMPTEPAAHVAHAANPTPSHAANHSHNHNHNHPPYAEMITAAIGALKDRKGSSRRAIAKYIDKAYSNLPPTHSALLTHHLKRLKKSGHLLMVKHSYKLPRSVPLSQVAGNDSSAGPKRGPGRPRKPKPETQLNNTGNGPGPGPGPSPESVLISVGLIDVPTTVAKRGPGRPPKLTTVPLGSESGVPTSVKRPRGRPRGSKPKPISAVSVMGVAGTKRGRGRPPGPANAARGIGRLKKDATSMAKSPGRPRGRPPKSVGAAAVPGVGDGGALVPVGISDGGGGVLPLKRPGRPPNSGGPKKPRKLSGRPLGRPKKNATTGINLSGQQRQQQLVSYEGLKTKLEQYQLRIKDAVDIVKPHLNAETAATAIRALHDLEELATVDVAADAAPLNVEVQEPLLQN